MLKGKFIIFRLKEFRLLCEGPRVSFQLCVTLFKKRSPDDVHDPILPLNKQQSVVKKLPENERFTKLQGCVRFCSSSLVEEVNGCGIVLCVCVCGGGEVGAAHHTLCFGLQTTMHPVVKRCYILPL